VQFASSLFEVLSWAIIKGSPAVRTAQQFLYFAGLPAIQVKLLHVGGESGLAKGLNDGLPPEVLAISASNPANLNASLRTDAAFFARQSAQAAPAIRQLAGARAARAIAGASAYFTLGSARAVMR